MPVRTPLVFLLYLVVVSASPDVYTIPLDHEGSVSLFWIPDFDHEKVDFELHMKMDKTLNSPWIAVGFSDYGNMFPADFCIFWTDWKGETHLTVKTFLFIFLKYIKIEKLYYTILISK
jgi:hypothetical protein